MGPVARVKGRLLHLYRRYILRDPFVLEAARWFGDHGDTTKRLDYPLNRDDVVFDIGGYHGDFAAEIYDRYGCEVFIFEPVPEFYHRCVERFENSSRIHCFNYGLASADRMLDIHLANDASSFDSPHATGVTQTVKLRSINECIRELGIDRIDLLKINIEGGEYDVLPSLIESGDIRKIRFLQIQFHNFVDSAICRRDEIRDQLALTHKEMWNYEFIWESWQLDGGGL